MQVLIENFTQHSDWMRKFGFEIDSHIAMIKDTTEKDESLFSQRHLQMCKKFNFRARPVLYLRGRYIINNVKNCFQHLTPVTIKAVPEACKYFLIGRMSISKLFLIFK